MGKELVDISTIKYTWVSLLDRYLFLVCVIRFFLECTYNYLFALSRVGFLEKCSFRQSHSNDDTKKTKRTNEPEKEKRKKSKTAFTAW